MCRILSAMLAFLSGIRRQAACSVRRKTPDVKHQTLTTVGGILPAIRRQTLRWMLHAIPNVRRLIRKSILSVTACMKRETRQSILYALLSLLPTLAFALPDDSQQPMHIVSDSSLFNYKTGQDIYEGNVKVDQGTSHLTADRVVTQKNSQHKMISGIAYGIKTLAVFTTIPKPGDLVMRAEAKTISFYPPTSTIVLEGDVTVTQGKNSFRGQHIIYNMKDQIVAAPASKNGRATIVIDSNQLK